jgi:DNA-binding MarR family transcriptional regulator
MRKAKGVRPSTMYLLHQASQAMRARLEQSLRDFQMTGIKYTVLAIIGGSENVSSADLSRRFFVTPQTMNEIVGDLVQRGLVMRREDPNTRRVLRLMLTLPGRRLLEKCERIANEVEERALAQFSSDKLSDLRGLLKALLTELRNGLAEPANIKPGKIARAGAKRSL